MEVLPVVLLIHSNIQLNLKTIFDWVNQKFFLTFNLIYTKPIPIESNKHCIEIINFSTNSSLQLIQLHSSAKNFSIDEL